MSDHNRFCAYCGNDRFSRATNRGKVNIPIARVSQEQVHSGHSGAKSQGNSRLGIRNLGSASSYNRYNDGNNSTNPFFAKKPRRKVNKKVIISIVIIALVVLVNVIEVVADWIYWNF
jgi:hypothetical protein